MKGLKKLLEKNYFDGTYVGIAKQNTERGYGRLIQVFSSRPNDKEYAFVMPFSFFIDYVMKHPIYDAYFFGPVLMAYEMNFRFKYFIKNRHLEQYFQDQSDEFIEEELLK